jgi:hypothetical protein
MLTTDRNRADLDWSDGQFTWGYRNRLTLERRFTIHAYHPAPYASAEDIYESKNGRWSRTNLYAGRLLPVGKHVQLNPDCEPENNTGKGPNQK